MNSVVEGDTCRKHYATVSSIPSQIMTVRQFPSWEDNRIIIDTQDVVCNEYVPIG